MHQIVLFLLTICCGCSPSSLSDYRAEEEARCKSMLKLLQEIHDTRELILSAPTLKNHFEKMVDVIVLARAYQVEHPDETIEPIDPIFQQALKDELMRIYSLEGGREIVEKAGHEALIRLDAHEKALFQN